MAGAPIGAVRRRPRVGLPVAAADDANDEGTRATVYNHGPWWEDAFSQQPSRPRERETLWTFSARSQTMGVRYGTCTDIWVNGLWHETSRYQFLLLATFGLGSG